MPTTRLELLPDDARVWVFAADRPVTGPAAERLLGEVDRYLASWKAHGHPLTNARDWRDDRFLVVAVDQREAHATGCSIDGLFRSLQALEPVLGASLVGGGRVFYRDAAGAVRSVPRGDVDALARQGDFTRDTRVFDPTVTTLGDLRARFETTVAESWHASLL